jgi:hypothetical protein
MVLFNLFSCDESSYPSILRVHNAQLAPFIGRKVTLDGDTTKTYTVGRQVLGAFYDLQPCSDAFTTVFTIKSIKYNGQEYLLSNQTSSIVNNVNPTRYYDYLNDAVGTYAISTGNPSEISIPFCGFSQFLSTVVQSLGIPVIVDKVHKDLFSNPVVYENFANLYGGEFDINDYENITIEKREEDSFEFTYSYFNNTSNPCSTTSNNNKDIRCVFDGVQLNQYVDGIEFSSYPRWTWDHKSFAPSSFIIGGVEQIPTEASSCAIVSSSFNTIVEFTDCGVDDCCDSLSFTDASTVLNTFDGHSVFGYRLIRVIRPDGTVYEYSSAASDDPDSIIQVLSTSNNNSFTYQFQSTDTDGVWEVQLYDFPEWDNTVMYNAAYGIVVHQNDVLYICKESNTNVSPEDDTDNVYWEPYTLDDTTLDTRYGESIKKVVLCISLIGCYRKMIEDALCSDDANPCAPLCDNKLLMQATKVRVIWDAILKAECNNDFDRVKELVDMWKSSCSCVNC